MTALVTGGAGFVAAYLVDELKSAGWDVVLTDVKCVRSRDVRLVDLTDAEMLRELVSQVKPDAVVHLGGISFVPDAEKYAGILERVNVGGTRNLISAIEAEAPKSRFLFVSTAQVAHAHLSEYAKSKLAAEKCVHDAAARGLDAIIVRPANHTGPGQSPKFVVPSFVKQAVEMKRGVRKKFVVGNLEAVRDFTDVRDVVRAYRVLLEKGVADNIYFVGSNAQISIGGLLTLIASTAGVSSEYEVNESLWRAADSSPIIDVCAVMALGWRAQISLEKTICDMLKANTLLPEV